MKKVLIITYYWPPSGGSGVQRWLKFVKYLPSFGWEPHVFTPENPTFGLIDPSLEADVPTEAEVIRFPIWEPYQLFFGVAKLFGRKPEATPTALVPSGRKTLFQRLSTWIRGNFFVPDPRRFWIRPATEFLADYIARNAVTTVITTGPPHSIHLIGLRLKKKHPQLRWLADFRDPWSEWGMWDSLNVSKPVRRIHRRLEAQVLFHADDILTITPFYVRQFERLSGRRVHLLTNGFDEDDFKDVSIVRGKKFVIRHVGIVNEKCDPRPFMLALETLMERDSAFAGDVAVEFIGEVHPDFRSFVAEHPRLSAVTAFIGSIPHRELLKCYGTSALLLLVLTGYKDAEGFLPGKLFEYLATGLPVLGVGPVAGDAGIVLKESGAGQMCAGDDSFGIQEVLAARYRDWKQGAVDRERSAIAHFSRRAITERLVALLENRSGAALNEERH